MSARDQLLTRPRATAALSRALDLAGASERDDPLLREAPKKAP